MFESFFKGILQKQEEEQQKERISLGLSESEYQALLQKREEEYQKKRKEIEAAEEEKRKQHRHQILTEVHPHETPLKCTKTNLNRIIHWGTSRYNEYKKKDVVHFVYATFQGNQKERQEDFYEDYTCGSYSERGHGARTGHYRVVVYQREVRLIVHPLDADKKVYKLV